MRDAKACVRKYLIADSVEVKLLVLIISGIKDNKFNSNPIHIPIHEDEHSVIRVPIIRVKIKINLEIKFIIKKKRIKTLMSGV